MKIGIICAMQEEIELLSQDIQTENSVTIAGRTFLEGRLYGKPVVLVRSRIGKVAAASTATTLIDRFHPDCVIFCGTAGGIGKGLHTGDIVVADRLIQHDVDTGTGNGFKIPQLNMDYFPTDPALSERLISAVKQYIQNGFTHDIPAQYLEEFGISAPKAVVGTIASGDQFICSKEKNQWLAEQIENLQCVEMEGAAVSQVCYEFGVPHAVIRVISDGADDASSVNFDSFIEHAACHFTRGGIKAFLESEQ